MPTPASTPLILINDWDFNWQSMYTLTTPIPFNTKDTIRVSSIFDNSDGNPKNPNNPIIPVSWGEGTTDEMVVGYIGIILDQEWLAQLFIEKAPHLVVPSTGAVIAGRHRFPAPSAQSYEHLESQTGEH